MNERTDYLYKMDGRGWVKDCRVMERNKKYRGEEQKVEIKFAEDETMKGVQW